MTKPKIVIRTLDLKPKGNSEGQLSEMIGKDFSKRIWESKFERLCGGIKKKKLK